jgi:hypothetical protein
VYFITLRVVAQAFPNSVALRLPVRLPALGAARRCGWLTDRGSASASGQQIGTVQR